MIRSIVWISILVLSGSGAVDCPGASAFSPGLLDPERWSLGGETVDIDDAWDVARLLARFGEASAACDAFQPVTHAEAADRELYRARLLTGLGRYEQADSLLALRTGAWVGRERHLHCLWRACLNAASGRYERALEWVERTTEVPDTLFDAYGDLVACDALLGIGNAGAASERAKGRLSRGVPAAIALEFETRLVDAYVRGGRTSDALVFLDSLRTRASRQPARAPLFAREAELRLLQGDIPGAVAAAVDLVKAFDTSSIMPAVDSVLTHVPAESLSNEALVELGEYLLRRGRASGAERLIAVLSSRVLDESQKERTRLMTGELFFKEKRYKAAEREMRARFTDPSSERRAKLLRARIYRGIGERSRAADAYEEFATAFPYDAKAAEALYVAWELQRDAGRGARAAGILERIVETYPGQRYARLATMAIVRDHVERREYARGARILEQALERQGREDAAFLYYLADTYDRMGQAEKRAKIIGELSALDPTSFYLDPEISSPSIAPDAFAAGADDSTAGTSLLVFLKSVLESRERAYRNVRRLLGADRGELDRGEGAAAVTKGRAFAAMGLSEWAEMEFRAAESVAGGTPGADLALASLFEEAAMPWRSIRAVLRVYYSLGRSERRVVESDLRLLTRPVPYPAVVLTRCRTSGLSPHLVYAMMREESRFDVRAISPAGAMGLMQIMPATGAQVAEEIGLAAEDGGGLLSPDVNVSLGVSYAARLLERWGGDPLKMLAAYNAGSTNAARWFTERNSRKPRVEQVDGIDFWETREYVKRIVESARLYDAFYFAPIRAATQRPDSTSTHH